MPNVRSRHKFKKRELKRLSDKSNFGGKKSSKGAGIFEGIANKIGDLICSVYMTGLVVERAVSQSVKAVGKGFDLAHEFGDYLKMRFSGKSKSLTVSDIEAHDSFFARAEKAVICSIGSLLTGLPKSEITLSPSEKQQGRYLRGFANRCFTVFVPMACVGLVASVVYYSQGFTMAVETYIDGELVAIIADQSEYQDVEGRVERYISSITGDDYELPVEPVYQVELHAKSDIGSADGLEEMLLSYADDVVYDSYGFYVDGQLVAVNPDKTELEEMLDRVLAAYTGDEQVTDERIEFVQDVRIEEGLYPRNLEMPVSSIEEIITSTTIQEKLYTIESGDLMGTIAPQFDMTVSELKALNPDVNERALREGMELTISKPVSYLTVKSVRTVVFEEAIPYSKEVVSDDSMYTYEKTVTRSGQEGTAEVTAEICLIDGMEISYLELDRETVAEPVTQLEKVGTLTPPPKSPTGSFVSPVSGGTVTSPYGPRWGGTHTGIDIATSTGTTIVSTDGGVVTFAGWSGGYGYMVKVDHGNGYSSWYAHCSSLLVSVGQQVAQGEPIARVGSTGNSTGPHVHFEIRINGNHVNPSGYIGR